MESPEPPGSVYLLDAHGMVFQMFHGIPSMNAPDGRPTNAVFGVTRGLMSLYDRGAQYLIAVFDSPGPTFRDDIVTDYKAHRPPPPEDLLIQEPLIDQVLEAMRIPRLSLAGYEADDIMATIADVAAARGHQVFLCTADKDCRQLVTDRIKIQNLRKDEILDREGIIKDWGVTPEQVVAYQALVGDSVDNVAGVAGVGAKTAAKWLQQFGTLENLIANADAVGGPKVKASLKLAIENGDLERSRKLVELKRDVPISFDWDRWHRKDWDGPRLLELFQQFGFRGFANKVRETMSKSGAARNQSLLEAAGISSENPTAATTPAARASSRPSLFDQINETAEFAFGANVVSAEPRPAWTGDYRLIASKKEFESFLKSLKQQTRFAFDLLTSESSAFRAEIVGLSFCWKAGEAWYIPLRGPKGSKTLETASVLASVKEIFENPAIGKTNQNIKQDALVLRCHDIRLQGITGDPMLAHYLLHAQERSHELIDLTRQFLGHEKQGLDKLTGKGKNLISLADVSVDKLCAYCCEEVDAAWRLLEPFETELTQNGLKPLYDDLELPLIEVLTELEYNGIRLDSGCLELLSGEMEQQLEAMEEQIHTLAGRSFNIASPTQLREVLFDQMKLPIQKRTDTTGEPSTDQESLEKLAALGHELPRKIIDYRSISKLKGTYVDALPELVNPKTGRLHTSFNQTVAATGRLSSSDPNLQNIPTRTEQGQQIRKAFIPAEGCQLLTADYSQIELRLLAHFCDDEQLQAAFLEDRDVHARVAAEIFKVPEDTVTSSQRRAAKTVNFGVIYGISAYGLAVRLGMPRKEAEQFIHDYFAKFPKVLKYQDNLLAKAKVNGYVATILGRRRYFDPIAIRKNSTYQQRNQAEREAINMEIQGSAADLMKRAMLGVHRRLKFEKLTAKMLLTVHDELVFEVPPAEVNALARLVHEEMLGAMSLKVPLKVDIGVGSNWLEVEDVP